MDSVKVNMDKININLKQMVALKRCMVQAQVHNCTETLRCLLDQYKAFLFETEKLWSLLPNAVQQNNDTRFSAESKTALDFISIMRKWLSYEDEMSTDDEDYEDIDVSEFVFLDVLLQRDSDSKRNVDLAYEKSGAVCAIEKGDHSVDPKKNDYVKEIKREVKCMTEELSVCEENIGNISVKMESDQEAPKTTAEKSEETQLDGDDGSDEEMESNDDNQPSQDSTVVNKEAVSFIKAVSDLNGTQTCSNPLITCDIHVSINVACDHHTGAGCKEEPVTGAGASCGLNSDFGGFQTICAETLLYASLSVQDILDRKKAVFKMLPNPHAKRYDGKLPGFVCLKRSKQFKRKRWKN